MEDENMGGRGASGTAKIPSSGMNNVKGTSNILAVGTGGKMSEIGFFIDQRFLVSKPPLLAVASADDYSYEVVKETEKAIQIKIDSKRRSPLKGDWLQWLPKSVIDVEEMKKYKKK